MELYLAYAQSPSTFYLKYVDSFDEFMEYLENELNKKYADGIYHIELEVEVLPELDRHGLVNLYDVWTNDGKEKYMGIFSIKIFQLNPEELNSGINLVLS